MTHQERLDRLPSIAVNPDMATREDVFWMAGELMAMRGKLFRYMEGFTGEAENIKDLLDGKEHREVR